MLTIRSSAGSWDSTTRSGSSPLTGAGSACGKNLSTERSTIGEQRRFSYACQPMSVEDFLVVVTEDSPAHRPASSTTPAQQAGAGDP